MKNFMRKIISFGIIVFLFAAICNCKKDSKQPELDNEPIVIPDEKPFVPGEAQVLLLPVEQYDSEEDFEWEILNKGKKEEEAALITKYLGGKSEINIPPSINGIPVTVIGKYAFSVEDSPEDGMNITGVKIPYTVTRIENNAFENNHITEINIPDSVTYIGEYAFSRNELTSIKFSANISYIQECVFSYNQLTELTIPENISSIGKFAFSHNLLTDLYIPETVGHIGDYAFEENQIERVTFNGNHSYMNKTVFLGNETIFKGNEIKTLIFGNRVTSIRNYAFSRFSRITEVIIGDNVETIGNNAFSYNQIASLVIGEKVREIGEGAFRNNKITELTIPNSVRAIRDNAFRDNQITSITLNERNHHIWEEVFRGNQITNVTINLNYHNDFIIYYEAFADNPITSIVITVKDNLHGNYFDSGNTRIAGDAFPNNFREFLRNNNDMAGTYTYDGKSWYTDNLNPGIRIVPRSYVISE